MILVLVVLAVFLCLNLAACGSGGQNSLGTTDAEIEAARPVDSSIKKETTEKEFTYYEAKSINMIDAAISL